MHDIQSVIRFIIYNVQNVKLQTGKCLTFTHHHKLTVEGGCFVLEGDSVVVVRSGRPVPLRSATEPGTKAGEILEAITEIIPSSASWLHKQKDVQYEDLTSDLHTVRQVTHNLSVFCLLPLTSSCNKHYH